MRPSDRRHKLPTTNEAQPVGWNLTIHLRFASHRRRGTTADISSSWSLEYLLLFLLTIVQHEHGDYGTPLEPFGSSHRLIRPVYRDALPPVVRDAATFA